MAHPSFKLCEKVLENKFELGKELARIIEGSANEAIKERGLFTIGVSGGSMASFVCSEVPKINTSWSNWKILFCDERMVPLESEDSTLKLYLAGLESSTPLTKKDNFIEVNTAIETADAAKDYERKLKSLFASATEWPRFDLLLLGVGPDGHTASLFPGHPLLSEESVWVAPITDSPKQPPCRVTLTMPAINNARKCIMALAGKGKASMVKELRRQFAMPASEAVYPAAKVRPIDGELILLMDCDASNE